LLSSSWLSQYARHYAFGPGTIVLGVDTVLSLALFVIGAQSIRAAFQNPAANLHSD
jgi:hypothetical protein